jgi:hypothetical protein
MSFAAITLYVASHPVFIVVSVYFVIDSVRKLLDTHSYLVRNTVKAKKKVKLSLCLSKYHHEDVSLR